MDTKASLLLTDVNPPSHIVYPCADEHLIAAAVGTFAASGLRKGDAVVLVTTEARRKIIERLLESETLDVHALQCNGQLAFLDAESLLSAFLTDGMPDAPLFRDCLGQIIEKVSLNPADGQPRNVRIFGEMVSLLYTASNVPAAARLEEFWNEMVGTHSVSLLCAYSLKLDSDRLPQHLLDAHSDDLSCVVH
jgi:hypothetical protein